MYHFQSASELWPWFFDWIAAGAVNAEKRTAVLDPGLKRSTLIGSKRIAARVVPDHQFELPEWIRIHHGAVLRDDVRPAAFFRDDGKRCVRSLY